MHDWVVWVVLAAALAGAETVSGTFVFLMTAGGAAGAAVAAGVGAPVVLQLVVFVAVTLALLALVRPVAVRHAHPGPAAITGTEALVGREAVVLEPVTRESGRVRLNGAEWTARPIDPAQDLPPGTRVSVIAIDGATAVVWQDPLAL